MLDQIGPASLHSLWFRLLPNHERTFAVRDTPALD